MKKLALSMLMISLIILVYSVIINDNIAALTSILSFIGWMIAHNKDNNLAEFHARQYEKERLEYFKNIKGK